MIGLRDGEDLAPQCPNYAFEAVKKVTCIGDKPFRIKTTYKTIVLSPGPITCETKEYGWTCCTCPGTAGSGSEETGSEGSEESGSGSGGEDDGTGDACCENLPATLYASISIQLNGEDCIDPEVITLVETEVAENSKRCWSNSPPTPLPFCAGPPNPIHLTFCCEKGDSTGDTWYLIIDGVGTFFPEPTPSCDPVAATFLPTYFNNCCTCDSNPIGCPGGVTITLSAAP
jgi:hypothetical protein